jgi:hypothetical protein
LLTNEFAAARTALMAGWHQVLGDERMKLVTPALESQLEEVGRQPMEQESVVRLTANRRADGTIRHQLEFEYFREGKKVRSSSTSVSFPTQPGSALWEYRHLFGTEPLIAAP